MTPTSLQKIVDDEMTQEMLALALREFDSDQSKWRTLAMALLEEQQWAKQISKMKSAREVPVASVSGKEVNENAGGRPISPIKPFVSLGGRTGAGSAGSSLLGVLAASLILCVGFAGGMFMFDRQQPSGAILESVASSVLKSSGDANSYLKSRTFDDRMKMVVTGPNDETAEIPIYDLGEIDPTEMWAKEDFELSRLNEQLRRKGYQLEVRPEYYTSKLNDGRQLVVPVKNVGLKPYGL